MVYVIGITVFSATRSLERFWSGIFDPAGLLLMDGVTRYWTVVEKNTLLMHWTGVFLYNRLVWCGLGLVALIACFALFPMSVEALTAVSSKRRAAKAKHLEQEDPRPKRSIIAAKLPVVRQVFDSATTWRQLISLTKLRLSNILREIPFWALVCILIAFAINKCAVVSAVCNPIGSRCLAERKSSRGGSENGNDDRDNFHGNIP